MYCMTQHCIIIFYRAIINSIQIYRLQLVHISNQIIALLPLHQLKYWKSQKKRQTPPARNKLYFCLEFINLFR